jgi:hypothetical protein
LGLRHVHARGQKGGDLHMEETNAAIRDTFEAIRLIEDRTNPGTGIAYNIRKLEVRLRILKRKIESDLAWA